MSNTDSDSFIREVTEEVRQDRMFHLWRRYGPFVIGAIVLIVGAAAIWNWLDYRRVLAARETGELFLEADAAEGAKRLALLESIEPPASVLADLRRAAVLASEGETDDATLLYRQTAARADAGPVYAQLATLSAVALDAARGDPATLIGEIAPLTAEDAPFRPLALELRGALRLQAGDVEAARQDFEAAVSAPMATGETRRRVSELIQALGPAPTPGAEAPVAPPAADPAVQPVPGKTEADPADDDGASGDAGAAQDGAVTAADAGGDGGSGAGEEDGAATDAGEGASTSQPRTGAAGDGPTAAGPVDSGGAAGRGMDEARQGDAAAAEADPGTDKAGGGALGESGETGAPDVPSVAGSPGSGDAPASGTDQAGSAAPGDAPSAVGSPGSGDAPASGAEQAGQAGSAASDGTPATEPAAGSGAAAATGTDQTGQGADGAGPGGATDGGVDEAGGSRAAGRGEAPSAGSPDATRETDG